VIPVDGSDVETKPVSAAGTMPAVPNVVEHIPEDTIKTFQRWGVILIPPVGERTPPFVDAILPNSPAAKAGLQTDDVIVMINGVLTPSLAAVEEQIYLLDSTKPVMLTVERNYTLVEITLANGE
jgi:S1-C subfamily serine protease